MEFTRDEAKARSNARKHGVTFEEAVTVFRDRNGIEVFDVLHSDSEARWGRLIKEVLLVSLDPDVAEAFPDAESVNRALRLLLEASRKAASTH